VNFLFILTLKSILSAIIGNSFYRWFQSTKMGVWFQNKLDTFMNYLSIKYDIEIAKKEAKWRKDYPLLSEKIDRIESRVEELEKGFNK